MSENTKLWDILGRTDPKHTQRFTRGGGFKGTAIKPIWSFRRMTEEFGPCGIGWGVGEPSFQVVPGENREVLVYCTASIWYRLTAEPTDEAVAAGILPAPGPVHTVYGVGGDKVVSHIKANQQYNRPERWESDDEAFKKAFTDAVTNALKLIGVGADVHMGRFDDSKYVREMQDEFAEEPPPSNGNGTAAKPKRQTGYSEDGNRTAYSLRQEKVWQEFERELMECKTVHALTKLALAWSAKAETDKWPEHWRNLAKEEINKRKVVVANSAPDDDAFPGDRPSDRNSYLENVGAM